MTEQECLASSEPRPMLDFLRGKASDRKLVAITPKSWPAAESLGHFPHGEDCPFWKGKQGSNRRD
jgi:hypothetical protein